MHYTLILSYMYILPYIMPLLRFFHFVEEKICVPTFRHLATPLKYILFKVIMKKDWANKCFNDCLIPDPSSLSINLHDIPTITGISTTLLFTSILTSLSHVSSWSKLLLWSTLPITQQLLVPNLYTNSQWNISRHVKYKRTDALSLWH